MKITVEHLSDDKLSRKAWLFTAPGPRLVLHLYAEQTRKTPRHKWVGPFWSSMDERRYYSELKRPTHIPPEVVDEAREKLANVVREYDVYIGWFNPDHLYKEGKS